MSEHQIGTRALLRSSIVARPPRNAELMEGYATGTIATIPAAPLFKGIELPPSMKPTSAKRRQITSYERAKIWGRKRQMGGAGKLPNDIRCWWTEGERAVLTVIGSYVKRYGQCTLSVESLAREAGVGVRTVQYTLALARGGKARAGRRSEPPSRPVLIHVEYRRERGRAFNGTNVITIVSREWLLWLHYRPSEKPDTGCTKVQPNSILHLQPLSAHENDRRYRSAGPPQGAYERERVPRKARTG